MWKVVVVVGKITRERRRHRIFSPSCIAARKENHRRCFSSRGFQRDDSMFSSAMRAMLREKVAFPLNSPSWWWCLCSNHLTRLAGRVFPCHDGLKFRVFHSIQLFLLVGQKSYSWFVCVLRFIKGICSYTAEFCLAKIKFTFKKFSIKVQKTLNRWRRRRK